MKTIPTDIKIVLRDPKTISRRVLGKKQTREVREAYAVPSTSPKMLETAIKWAKGFGYVAKSWMKSQPGGGHYAKAMAKKPDPDIVERPNDVFTALQVWEIDERGEGGRAIKVVTEEGWYFDLREPEFLEACLSKGMTKGGGIKGRFQWILNGTQMRIGIVGGGLHKEALADMKVESKPKPQKIAVKDLVPGGVYTSASNQYQFALYAGRVRVRGKLMCAWVYPNILGGEATEEGVMDFLQHWTLHYKQPTVTLMGGCSYTEHLFTLSEVSLPEGVAYCNGYGETIDDPVTWE